MADRRRHLNALPDLIVRFRETLISFPRIKKSVPQFADNDFAGYRTKRKGVDVVYVRRDWLERFCGPLTKRLLDQLVAEQVIQPGEGARSGKQVRVLVGGNLQKPRFLMLDEEKLLG
ncbi:MAG: hypothetical protein KDK08_07960 [Rhizobiaceae bacterium]|nr:hypothetical protein [Rhizobiaceae bacterium]